MNGSDDHAALPLVVDLDGTLLPITSRTIMVARLLWRHPRELSYYRTEQRRDRHAAKMWLWDRVGVSLRRVPIRRRLLRRLESEAATGRRVFIASGAPAGMVDLLVDHLDIVEEGWGSEVDRRVTGEQKADLLVERFGEHGFVYIGDAREDLEVWGRAARAVVYWPSNTLERDARRLGVEVEVVRRPIGATVWIAALFVVTALRQIGGRPDDEPVAT